MFLSQHLLIPDWAKIGCTRAGHLHLTRRRFWPDWMAIIREDFGQQTYWRIYLRTTAQDGSQGAPLTEVPWDFSARTGDPMAYENGGRLANSIPSGYWFDLTSLAVQYGWERLPALTEWRTYYAGARFNELAFTQGLGLAYRHVATLPTGNPGYTYDGYSTHPHTYTYADVVPYTDTHCHVDFAPDQYAMNRLQFLLPVTLIILSGCAPTSGPDVHIAAHPADLNYPPPRPRKLPDLLQRAPSR